MKALIGKARGPLKKYRTPGIIVAILLIIACELPLVLALLGFASLFNLDSIISFSPVVTDIIRLIGIIVALFSLCYLIYRFQLRIRK